jgi:hypothetical protein
MSRWTVPEGVLCKYRPPHDTTKSLNAGRESCYNVRCCVSGTYVHVAFLLARLPLSVKWTFYGFISADPLPVVKSTEVGRLSGPSESSKGYAYA